MTLSDERNTVEVRPGETFFQRGAFTFGDDVINGYFETSEDGETWKRDFDIEYTRITV
jgi:hypothetical protein